MFKKLLSLVLVFSLLLSVASVVGANAKEESTSFITEGAYELTSALGIIKYEKSDFNKNLTRGELAEVICSLMNIPAFYGASVFTDVSLEDPHLGYINALYNASIVSGSSTGVFEPDRQISFNEAVTMLVRALGYVAKAEYSGGYPTGYLMVAKQEKLLEGLTVSNGLITKGEMVQLCYNALESDAMVFMGTSEGEPVFGTSKGYTLGEYVFGLKHITGIVKAVDISAIQGENKLKSGYVLVGGVRILAGAPVLWEYLGYEADVWYVTTKKGENELKYIKKSDYNRVIEVALTDIISINRGLVEYYDEKGEKKSATYKVASPVIYNTVATYESFNMDMLKNMDGGIVKLISNDNNKIFDVIFVEAYQDYVVSSLSAYKMTLNDKFDSSKKIVLNTKTDDPYTIIYDAKGEEIAFNSIKKGDVISVYASKNDADQKFIKAVKHTDVVDGEVRAISYLDGTCEITIGDAEYKLTRRCFKNCKGKFEVGNTITASLNLEGEISNIIPMSTGMEFVYLMGINKTNGFDTKQSIKVLNMDKTFSIYDLAEKVTIDEHVYENGYCDDKTILEALIASSKVLFPKPLVEDCVTQPVQIKVSDAGVVTHIDTMLTERGTVATINDVNKMDALYKIGSTKRGNVTRRNGNNFGNQFLAPFDCLTVSIPTPEDPESALKIFDEEAYRFTTAYIFTDLGTIDFVSHAFSTKADTLFAEYIITPLMGESFAQETPISVIKSVRKTLLPDGGEGYSINVVNSGSEGFLMLKDDMHFTVEGKEVTPEVLKQGDVIRYVTNASGQVGNNGLELLFSPADKKIYKEMKPWEDENGNTCYRDSLHYNYPVSWGYVYDVYDDAITFAENILDLDAMPTFNPEVVSMTPIGGTAVMYDQNEPEGRRLIYASLNDIAGYKDVKTDCSFIFYFGKSTRMQIIYIINGYDLTE